MSKKKKESESSEGFSLEEIIMDADKPKGKVAKIMQDRAAEASAEYEATKLERLVTEEKMALEKMKRGEKEGKTVEGLQTQNYLQSLFVGRSAEEVNQIIESLTPEHAQKLALVTSAMNNNQLGMLMQVLGKPDRSINDTVQLIKTVIELRQPPQANSNTKEILEAFKIGLEANKSREATPKKDPMEVAMQYIKPIYDTMSQKDQLVYQAQLDNVKSMIIDPISYLEKIKEVAPSLGFVPASQGGTPNLEIEKLRMDQEERKLEHEKWKYEREYQQRKEYQEMMNKRQVEKERNKLIRDIAVPAIKKLAPMVDAAVTAGQQKIKTVGGGVQARQTPAVFPCPECAKQNVETLIDISGEPDIAVCPTCHGEFPKKG